MQLFTADLYRNFALGFLAGALIMGVTTIDQWSDEIAPPARAAEPRPAPEVLDDFIIEPLEETE